MTEPVTTARLAEMMARPAHRQAVCFAYAEMFERFAEVEQVAIAQGRAAIAEGARIYANRILRAWEAEQFDPEPAA